MPPSGCSVEPVARSGSFNPKTEVKAGGGRRNNLLATRGKAGLKPTQSKRWREMQCDPVNAERLDCVRFIAAFSSPVSNVPPSASVRSHAHFGIRVKIAQGSSHRLDATTRCYSSTPQLVAGSSPFYFYWSAGARKVWRPAGTWGDSSQSASRCNSRAVRPTVDRRLRVSCCGLV